jgi:hypothetical protein
VAQYACGVAQYECGVEVTHTTKEKKFHIKITEDFLVILIALGRQRSPYPFPPGQGGEAKIV